MEMPDQPEQGRGRAPIRTVPDDELKQWQPLVKATVADHEPDLTVDVAEWAETRERAKALHAAISRLSNPRHRA